MWAINNRTRFEAGRAFARDADGAEIWIVALRATFSFDREGRVSIAENQQRVCVAPIYFNAPTDSSLRYDMDIVRSKPGTDIIVHAHAHTPDGKPAPHVDVAWTVGPLSKALRVFGDRVWELRSSTLMPSEPTPFVKFPIRYEHAWGGWMPQGDVRDSMNPVGVGRVAAPGKPVPNCEHPDNPIRSSLYKGHPAGFGPIPYHWQPRVALAGTYDDTWKRTRQPLIPNDFQDAYLRCAPVDQQVNGFLTGGEDVVLRNLTPDGIVRFRLPRIGLGFTTRIGGENVHHAHAMHTVIIEPEDRQIILVWQTSLPCHHTLYTLEETTIFEKELLFRESSTQLVGDGSDKGIQ